MMGIPVAMRRQFFQNNLSGCASPLITEERQFRVQVPRTPPISPWQVASPQKWGLLFGLDFFNCKGIVIGI